MNNTTQSSALNEDLLLQMRVKNNVLYQLAKKRVAEMGANSITDMFRKINDGNKYISNFGQFVNLSVSPYRSKNGEMMDELRDSAVDLSRALGWDGDSNILYPKHLYLKFEKNFVEVEMDSEKFVSLTSSEALRLESGQDLNKEVDRSILVDNVNEYLEFLSPRERHIIEMRFGLIDGIGRTLEEVGKEYGVSRDRIRQIEAKCMQKLRERRSVGGKNKLLKYFES